MGIPGRNGTKAGECQPVQGKGCLEFSGMKQEMGHKREAEVWFRRASNAVPKPWGFALGG